MRRLNQTFVATLLFSLVTVGLTETRAESAESWLWWRKSSGSDSSQKSSSSSPAKKNAAVDPPISQQYATTPTNENRRQIAPSNTVTLKPQPKERWWDRLRPPASRTEKHGETRDASKSTDEVPVVIKKSPPPSTNKQSIVRKTLKSNVTTAKVTADFDDERVVNSNEFEDSDVEVITSPRPQSKPSGMKPSPRLQIGRSDSLPRRQRGPIATVGFDGDNDPKLAPLTSQLRQDPQKDKAMLPFEDKARSPRIQLRPSTVSDELISLTVRDAPLSMVLSVIAEQHGFNLVAGGEIDGRVTVTLNDVPLDEALNALLKVNGYSWHRNQNILIVSKLVTESRSSPILRGVGVRVFRLNYIAALDVEKVVNTLLSPVGRAVITMVDLKNTRRTREEIVVEDLPEYMDRIATYIAEVDRPPRQVLIEAHVLQVSLKENCLHGVNLQKLINVGNTQISLQTTGFANPKASPAFFFGIDNNDFHSLVQALSTLTDSKTLATPQVLCLNGQHARIQVGQQLGFLVTTTTQTSTLQNVNFLDVGVVLDVTPIITDEGLVMLHVKPEVSNGQISANGLPQEDTTEVETTVMLADGHGMVIGGLIKEEDTEVQTKIPYLGDLWVVGRMFQQRTVTRQRNEIIIALIPYILPYPDDKPAGMDDALERAGTRLLSAPLERMDRRRWEPDPPDAVLNPKHIFSGEILRRLHNPYGNGLPDECEEQP